MNTSWGEGSGGGTLGQGGRTGLNWSYRDSFGTMEGKRRMIRQTFVGKAKGEAEKITL